MKINTKHFNLCLLMIISSLITISCTSSRVFTFNVSPITPSKQVDQQNLQVMYDGFSVSYDTDGTCQVTNMRDSTFYIDLGESYVISNGIAQRIYSNSVITTMNSQSNGTSVNLGAVAGAVGIGGRAGILASGINVGQGSSSGTSVQSFEERYISVPPYSTVKVKFTNYSVMLPEYYKKTLPKSKTPHYYSKGQLYTVDHILSYSFSPNLPFKQVRNSLYISSVEGGKKGYKKNESTEHFDSVGLKIFAVGAGVVGLALMVPMLFL